ncbi:MAG: phage holin family protein [Clostridia bacterium]
MKKQGLKLLANLLGIYIMTSVFSLIEAHGLVPLAVFAVVLWFIYVLLRPLLLLVALPINILTLGIFSLVINAWLIMLTDVIVRGIYIDGFGISFVLAILIMIINFVLKKTLCSER